MKEQWKLLKAIQGQRGGGRWISDDNKKARQEGWRCWATHNWSTRSSQLFEEQLPLIRNEFPDLLGSFGRSELKNQIRYLLVLSNLVDDVDITVAPSPESPMKRQRVANITIGEHGATAISPEGEGMEVDNDEDWRDFAQQMEDARYKELGTITFWDKLDGDNLKDYYQKVLIGIETAENGKKGKPTKGNIMKTVKQFLARHKAEKNDSSEYIDITEAIQLETPDEEGGTHSAKRREATRAFFSHESRRSEVDPHYLDNPGEGSMD